MRDFIVAHTQPHHLSGDHHSCWPTFSYQVNISSSKSLSSSTPPLCWGKTLGGFFVTWIHCRLKSAALAFIVKNLATIVSDAGWQVQLAGHPHLMAQIIQSMANMPSSSSSHSTSPAPKKRRKELRGFKEALLSAMRSSDEEEIWAGAYQCKCGEYLSS